MMNRQKLSSHLWFFLGFCKTLKPEFTCLIDCGTVPDQNGVFNYFKVLETQPHIGGVCGYMGCRVSLFPKITNIFACCKKENKKNADNNKRKQIEKKSSLKKKTKIKCNLFYFCVLILLYPYFFLIIHMKDFICWLIYHFLNFYMNCMEALFSIENAQLFEYTFAHIFDKAFESMFGFIAVLPGAWSAYRWDALEKDELLEKEYLKTVLDPDYSFKTVKEANQILAEDRLLCLAIFTKKDCNYTLS